MKRRTFLSHWLPSLLLIAGIDRVLKSIAIEYVTEPNKLFFDHVHFGYYVNEGIGFGLPIGSTTVVIITTAILLGLLFLMLKNFHRFHDWQLWSIGFWLAGGFANWYDRIRYGHVIDYIEWFGIGVWNLADLAIIAGVAVWLWRTWRNRPSHPAR